MNISLVDINGHETQTSFFSDYHFTCASLAAIHLLLRPPLLFHLFILLCLFLASVRARAAADGIWVLKTESGVRDDRLANVSCDLFAQPALQVLVLERRLTMRRSQRPVNSHSAAIGVRDEPHSKLTAKYDTHVSAFDSSSRQSSWFG